MEPITVVSIVVPLLVMWGTLWYRLGKLTSDVRHHNWILSEIQKQLERIITGGDSDGREN